MAVLADRYELGEPLGSGGMARVVAAYDHVLHRDVAIKLIHDAFAGDAISRERMLREARAAASLHHHNTVAVFDAGETDGRPFIVMERVVGRSLADRLRDEGPLSVAETIAIADAVLSALSAAHTRRLVHRDVKPSNILLPDAGGVKLADFGIAKALAETSAGLTSTGQLLGTPRYLAPEQIAGRPASPASDLYSLGVVLYQCLTGEPPFTADTPLAEALAHQREPVPSVSDDAPHAPVAVARAIERAMAKEPEGRFVDAATMRRALRDPAVTSAPPPPAASALATAAGSAGDDTDPTQYIPGPPQPGPGETAVTQAVTAITEPVSAAAGSDPDEQPTEVAAPVSAAAGSDPDEQPTEVAEPVTAVTRRQTAVTQPATAATAVVPPPPPGETRLLEPAGPDGDTPDTSSGSGSKRRWVIVAAVVAAVALIVILLVNANRSGSDDLPSDPPPADDGGDSGEDSGDGDPGQSGQDGGDESGAGGGRGDEPRVPDDGQPGDEGSQDDDPDDSDTGDDTGSDEQGEGDGGDIGDEDGEDGGDDNGDADGDDGGGDDPDQTDPEDDLDDLIDDLDEDPDDAGEQGEDLVEGLAKVRDENNTDKRAERARKLVEETASWLAKGELTAAAGGAAIRVLNPIGRPADPALAAPNDLFIEVALDKRGWGEKADNLLSDLNDVLAAGDPRSVAKEADDLLDDLEDWIDDGEIEQRRGSRAAAVLRRLT
ncbi:serine/threonine-protein kinase [Phytoactinopolyspora limicola]|uniref:serine/threonine-protein kinase n=1 Tax=Phytoactinopolyspora limicola TaxID=2715536 RepID=UPI00140B2BB8|nr:serine/threonine-protein kinase [Phytoactinopolyspora limicola]